MEKTITKVANGVSKNSCNNKNRLRIQGVAVLERENETNITASYDYTTLCPSDFFEEDVKDLQSFELNKIAMGMTIYKKEDNSLKLKNGFSHHEKGTNGINGTSLALQHYRDTNPTLTDVIWSRMDIANPISNRNAYIIKQYYNSKNPGYRPSHAEKCNTFLCGFICCCMIMAMGYAVALLPDRLLQV